jgi:hypothetical protein
MQSTVSAVSAAEKWAIGGKTTPHLPTTSGGGDWMVLGKQLQRMVSLRLQDAEGISLPPPPSFKLSLSLSCVAHHAAKPSGCCVELSHVKEEPSMTLTHITLTLTRVIGVCAAKARDDELRYQPPRLPADRTPRLTRSPVVRP